MKKTDWVSMMAVAALVLVFLSVMVLVVCLMYAHGITVTWADGHWYVRMTMPYIKF